MLWHTKTHMVGRGRISKCDKNVFLIPTVNGMEEREVLIVRVQNNIGGVFLAPESDYRPRGDSSAVKGPTFDSQHPCCQ